MKYFVTIGERTIEVDLRDGVVTVDGIAMEARIEAVSGTPEVRLLADGRWTTLLVDHQQGSAWRLVDGGAVRDLEVEDERARHIRQLAGAGKATDGQMVLKAPMPGLVLRVLVEPGVAVTAGMPLLALEAMKMENELKASAAGVVTAVRVTAGQAVEKGQVLLEIGQPAAP